MTAPGAGAMPRANRPNDGADPAEWRIKPQNQQVFLAAGPSRPPLPIPYPDIAGSALVARHARIVGQLPDLGCYTLENCLMAESGYVLDADSLRLYDAPDIDHPSWRERYQRRAYEGARSGKPVRRVENDGSIFVKLINPGYRIYGHWIIDLLPAAWLLKRMTATLPARPVTFVIGHDTPSWAVSMIRSLAWHDSDRLLAYNPETELLAFDRITVPSNVRMSPFISPLFDEFVADIMRVTSRPADRFPERFMISRGNHAHTGRRTLVSRNVLEEAAIRLGLPVICPEELPWTAQISLFQGARLVVGEFGSGLHNTIFASEGCDVLSTFNSRSNMNQTAIGALRRQRVQYVPATAEQVQDGDFAYDIDAGRFIAVMDEFVRNPGPIPAAPTDRPSPAGRSGAS